MKSKKTKAKKEEIDFEYSFSAKEKNARTPDSMFNIKSEYEVTVKILWELRYKLGHENMLIAMKNCIVETMIEKGIDNRKSITLEVGGVKGYKFTKVGSKQSKYNFKTNLVGDLAGQNLLIKELK